MSLKNKLLSIWGRLLAYLKSLVSKEKILTHLKTNAVKQALIKILGSTALGGFRVYVITFIVNNLFDKLAEPIIELGLRKVGLLYNRTNGKIQITKLNNTDQMENENEYDDIVTDILS